MLHISICVYKPSGKWYTSGEATSEENIPLWDDAFKQFVREHLPAQINDGYVVVNDCDDGEGFHHVLYTHETLRL